MRLCHRVRFGAGLAACSPVARGTPSISTTAATAARSASTSIQSLLSLRSTLPHPHPHPLQNPNPNPVVSAFVVISRPFSSTSPSSLPSLLRVSRFASAAMLPSNPTASASASLSTATPPPPAAAAHPSAATNTNTPAMHASTMAATAAATSDPEPTSDDANAVAAAAVIAAAAAAATAAAATGQAAVHQAVANMRLNYTYGELNEEDLASQPIDQFDRWFREAVAANVHEPNGMTLATVSATGRPSSRVVLLKGYGVDGFQFFTNHGSHKGSDMVQNKHVALSFWWGPMDRQVRIEGVVERLSEEESTAYFQSRPRGSQIGAHASLQSQVIPDRKALELRTEAAAGRFKDAEVIEKPANWGGYLVRPTEIEFWQGRPSRLHDRLRYRLLPGLTTDGLQSWQVERLCP